MRTLVIGFIFLAAGCSSQEPAVEERASLTEGPTASTPSAHEGGTSFGVPADPSATYSLLSVEPGNGGSIIAMTRRTGTSGTSYSNREIDCGAQLARYVGEGGTREDAEGPAPNPGDMMPLVEGSSTHAAVQVACSKR